MLKQPLLLDPVISRASSVTFVRSAILLPLTLLMLVLSSPTWSAEYLPNATANITTPAPTVEIKNFKHPFPGILTGGQPVREQLVEAKNKGYKTIISLRARSETGLWDEGNTVRELGMKYISIPVSGSSSISAENSRKLVHSLSDPKDYPIMVHCGSGDRVGALFALDAGINQNIAIESALEIGRKAGLNRLEPAVKKILE